jgi:hypothetical protein
LCTEFWWRTLQPHAGDWLFGTAAAPAAAKTGHSVQAAASRGDAAAAADLKVKSA